MTMNRTMVLGAIIMSVLASLAFIAALVIAYLSKDPTNQQLLIGAVISNFSTTISFWLGSSAGSQKKDEAASGKVSNDQTTPTRPPG